MHGTLRLILAFLVALSHLGVLHPQFNQGVFAVVIFYILAGMVSYKLISNYFLDQPLLYYKDRIKRIFPFYYIALGIAFVAYLVGASSYFISKLPDITDILSNLTIIPLSYYMFTAQDTFTLLPPVWSLGVELQFYILIPFLLSSNRLFKLIFILSFTVFSLASIGLIDTNMFGYRLIIGVIFIFMIGVMIQKARYKDKDILKYIVIIYLLLISLSIYIYIIDYKALYNYETILALLISIPFLFYFNSPVPIKIDKYLGSISYGIFLLHFPSLWMLQTITASQPSIYLILLLTTVLSIIIQKILNTIQYKNRKHK